jgi:hypothetical protein
MASTLREEEPFATHHRMHLSLAEVLSASDDHRQWKFRTFGYLRDGRWLEAPSNDNVQVALTFAPRLSHACLTPACLTLPALCLPIPNLYACMPAPLCK